ncbi:MAG: hypothetical protein H0T53_00475 [Herpetosiphonaceae bacterium]|nr:hypothetical protein [Herpetosiphonaceae bacterium]
MLRSYLRAIGGAVLLGVLLCWIALQRPIRFTLDIGGELTIGPAGTAEAPLYDAPYLIDVHAAEPAEIVITTTETYRWTLPESQIRIPGISGGPMITQLRLAPPSVPTTTLTITLNGADLVTDLAAGPHDLYLFTPAAPDGSGSLQIDLAAPMYELPPDPRGLGVTLYGIDVAPVGWRVFVPWALLAALAGVLVCLGAGAALAGFSPRLAGGTVLVSSAALALALTITRTVITVDAERLLSASAAGVATILVGRGLARTSRRLTAERRDLAIVAGLTGLALALRLVGLRHPQANFSDLYLNVNNLTELVRGEVIFTEGLTCEAGAGNSPYPPGIYVVLAPLLLLFRDPASHHLIMQVGGALLDALALPLIWWAVRALGREGSTRRAALWAATLYLIPTAVLRSLIIGEYTNAVGQALALPGMLGLIVWVGSGMPRRWRPAVLAALTIAALMHSGVLIAVGLWGVAWFVMLLIQRRWPEAGQLALLGGVAVGLAGLVYYSSFIGDPTLASTNPDCPVFQPVVTKFWNLLTKDLLTIDGQIPIWLWALGVGGALAARRRLPSLSTPLWAWLATFPLALTSLIWSEQTIRWWLFLTPALAIGGGVGLDALSARGRRSRWVAVGITLAVLAVSLTLWIRFIVRYRTGNFIP